MHRMGLDDLRNKSKEPWRPRPVSPRWTGRALTAVGAWWSGGPRGRRPSSRLFTGRK